jgi:hypothetical protein
MISRAFWEQLTSRDQPSRGPYASANSSFFFNSRKPRLDAVKTNGLLGKLKLDMSKAALHMRNTGGHGIEPLLGAINRRTHVPEMFEDQVFCVFGHY